MRKAWLAGWVVAWLCGAPAPGAAAAAAPDLVPASVLAFDAELKQARPKATDTSAAYTFWVTNVCATNVLILGSSSSCGCTVARFPSLPWALAPLESGPIHVTLDLRGRRGVVMKGIEISSSAGLKALVVRADLPTTNLQAFPSPRASTNLGHSPGKNRMPLTDAQLRERARNLQTALGDRQAVFKGDCARCHAQPGGGKAGAELYEAVCGICHDADFRAAMVPDLSRSPATRQPGPLRELIVKGRPGTLMPGFGARSGGPLTEGQIDSLVQHLLKRQTGPAKETGQMGNP